MSARDRILERLSRNAAATVAKPAQVQPRLRGEQRDRFIEQFELNAGTWQSLIDLEDLPELVEGYRQANAIAGPTVVAPVLRELGWKPEETAFGTTDGSASLSVSQATLGIAETGSLLLQSGPDTPTRLNFLPDTQIVVLDANLIVGHLEEAWHALGRVMPRAVNLITGPSRTADVEQTIQLGAHGPRVLHLVLVG